MKVELYNKCLQVRTGSFKLSKISDVFMQLSGWVWKAVKGGNGIISCYQLGS